MWHPFVYDVRWCIRNSIKNLCLIVKCVFITYWCPANKLEWYKVIMLSAYFCGIASNAVSFSGIVTNLTNNESNSIYLSTNVSTFLIVYLLLGSLFSTRYKYKSLKCGLINYPACISFTVIDKCVPFRTFICIIFNILSIAACFGKSFYTSLPVSTWPCNSLGSWKYDLSGLWYISDITPSRSSKSMLISFSNKSMSKSNVFLGIKCVGISVSLGGGL